MTDAPKSSKNVVFHGKIIGFRAIGSILCLRCSETCPKRCFQRKNHRFASSLGHSRRTAAEGYRAAGRRCSKMLENERFFLWIASCLARFWSVWRETVNGDGSVAEWQQRRRRLKLAGNKRLRLDKGLARDRLSGSRAQMPGTQ